MADVEALCKRVIVIHHGKLLFDGDLAGLVEKFSAYKTIGLTVADANANLARFGEVLSQDGARFSLRIPKSEASRVTAQLLTELQVDDLTVEAPPVDDVIDHIFTAESVAA